VSDDRMPDTLAYTLLVVDDEHSIRMTLSEALRDDQTSVLAAPTGRDAMEILARESVDLVLLDQKLKESGEDGIDVLREIKARWPHVLVIMMTAYGRIESAVEATKLGCFQYITKPLEIPQLRLLIRSALQTVELRKEVEVLRSQRDREIEGEQVFGSSQKMQDLLENVRKIGKSGASTVLIRGETGVGKELIARRIHYSSEASKGPFVDLNCAAVPDNLLESELFGTEAGAFTNAKSQRGLLEMADRGTLFLDEIGEMPLGLQSKLLRVFEQRTFRRVGGRSDVRVHVRFVAATNKDLFQEVEAKRFREDLYYRLTVIPIHVPPLRDRKDDIGLLAKYFLQRFNTELGGKIERVSDKAMELLANYRWPGNVRELKNLMERLVLMHSGPEILPEDLPPQLRGEARPGASGKTAELLTFNTEEVVKLEKVERLAIEHGLRVVGGNKTRAAELLGCSRQTLRAKIKDYAIATTGAEAEAEAD